MTVTGFGFWTVAGLAQQAAIAATGGANAVYFGGRALREPRPARRLAVLVLCALFAGVALEGAALIAGSPAGAMDVVRRMPLLLGCLMATGLVAAGARR